MGCLACRAIVAATGVGGSPWSRFEVSSLAKVSHLIRHENTQCHRRASLKMGGASAAAVPTADDFEKVLRAREEHKSLSAG
eukprot:15804016-Heterocapsa_arctica.AAC.1